MELAYLRAIAAADPGHDIRRARWSSSRPTAAWPRRSAAPMPPTCACASSRVTPTGSAAGATLAQLVARRPHRRARIRGRTRLASGRRRRRPTTARPRACSRSRRGALLERRPGSSCCGRTCATTVRSSGRRSKRRRAATASRSSTTTPARQKSYRLMPRVDAFLKERLLRARVQLVSAGGDTDTQASAATRLRERCCWAPTAAP